MSLLYPRTIEVHRSKTNANQTSSGSQTIGLTEYSGRQQTTSPNSTAGEIVLYTGIAAAISVTRPGRTKGGMLPGDAANEGIWLIAIDPSALPQYAIRDRDIIVDDEQYRYEVAQNYWTSLGYQLNCIRLET